MEGQPVWLASFSQRFLNGVIIATGSYSRMTREVATEILRGVVDGVGNPHRERLFRMNVTLCLHRALTDEEVKGLPADFHAAEAIHIAGGPVEVLWENVPARASTRPCTSPTRLYLTWSRRDLWIPEDCGRCAPCQARAAISSYRPQAAREELSMQGVGR